MEAIIDEIEAFRQGEGRGRAVSTSGTLEVLKRHALLTKSVEGAPR